MNSVMKSISVYNSFLKVCSTIFRKFYSNGLRDVKPGKTAVVITGCDSGLGFTFANHCMSRGIIVFGCTLDPESEGSKKLKTRNAKIFQVDVRNNSSVKKAARTVEEIINHEHYELLAVVNNAGIFIIGEFEWLTDGQIEDLVQVNFLGSLRVTKSFIPLLRQHKGRILNISSHCSKMPLPTMSVYGATKSALDSWSTALRYELDKFDIKVVSLMPGSYVTQSRIMSRQKQHMEEMEKNMSLENMKLYKNYFNNLKSYICGIGPDVNDEIKCIEDKELLRKFDMALLTKNPKQVYINSPFRYTFYHFLFNISPTERIRNYFIDKFICFPKFEK